MTSKVTRPIRIEGNIAFVPLTQGYEAIIDVADVPLVEGFNWIAMVSKRADGSVRTVYAYRNDCSGTKTRLVLLHRFLMGEPMGLQIDHRDGEGLNCRRYNLREATCSQNGRNLKTSANNTSGIKGVSWHKPSSKWTAHIMLGGKQKYLGLFGDITDAAVAYANASRELHGEFGRLA
jgi:hypothetical protein